MSDFLSFAFTIYKLGDERMAGINPHNVYNALTCISEGGETDSLQASKELVQLFTVEYLLGLSHFTSLFYQSDQGWR